MASALKIIGYLIIAAFLALLVLLAVLFGVFTYITSSTASSVSSDYWYDLSLSTEQTLDNVTLLIPLPVYYDETAGANRTVMNITDTQLDWSDPGDIVVSSEEIDGIPMLKISAAEIRPIYRSHIEPIAILPGQDEDELPQPTHIYSDTYSQETPELVSRSMHLQVRTDGLIDTKDPIGKAPLLEPYTVLKEIGSGSGTGTLYGDYYIPGGTSAFLIGIPVYASYTTAGNNTLVVSAEFTGINQRWVLGWQSNSYSERFTATLAGSQDGWHQHEAILVAGDGVYWD
jgi:hypothetical protein